MENRLVANVFGKNSSYILSKPKKYDIQSRPINRYTINRYETPNRYGFLEIFVEP